MFTKIISFLLVYILTIINFFVFLTPLTFLFIGKYFLNMSQNGEYIRTTILLLISAINVITIFLLIFDFIFAFSVRKYTKNTINCGSSDKYKALNNIFISIKEKFAINNVNLYISKEDVVNAYAVGSLRKNAIILTSGILNFYSSKTNDRNEALLSMKGIMSHEMSHIINNDYFTGILLTVNERSLRFISKFVFLFFNIFIKICGLIPFIGIYLANFIVKMYSLVNFLINFFYSKILLKIYNFIQLKLSRNIEYRADSQASQIVGGSNMANTLSLLGNNGYISIFSTHPLTKHRVKNVKDIEIAEKTIKPVLFSRFMFIITIVLLLSLCYYPYKLANINVIINDYNSTILFFKNKYMLINSYISNFLQK